MSSSMSPLGTFPKGAGSKVVLQFDWTRYLADLGTETITAVTFTISGGDSLLTKDNASIITGGQKVQLRLMAGTAGQTYKLKCAVTISGSPTQEDFRDIDVKVKERL